MAGYHGRLRFPPTQMETTVMLFRPLGAAIWRAGFRAWAPYDERHGARYGERYDGRPGRYPPTLPRPSRDRWDDRPPRGPSRAKAPALVGLALAAVLVVGATIAVEARLTGGKSTVASGPRETPTAQTSADATATTAAGQPKNWTQAGQAYAQRAAFAESAPARMYACGFQASNAQTGPISVAVSQDVGSTWQTLATPAKGAYCDVRVSTNAPQDVALFASALCDQESCTSNDPNQLYLSTDSGAH
jgi:hypothetical protein